MSGNKTRLWLDELQAFGIKLGLENIRTLCAALDDPQTAFPSVHVAGTNGKGSVCAMLAEILREAGFRVGLYTSPHLVRVEERVRVNGRPIPPRDFDRLLRKVRDRVEALLGSGRLPSPPTYFEALTALAWLHFRERGVGIAVLEVGMGGRFDATNIVTPLVSVITSISRDHEEHLGRTIAAIAFEKAGIVKPGRPVVCGARNDEAERVVAEAAAERRSPLVRVFGDGHALSARRGRGRWRFDYRFRGETFSFSPGLAGLHQGENGAIAVAAARVLSRVWHKPIEKTAIVEGLEKVCWEGRLELVRRRPRLLLDGAHNEAGMRALRTFIETDLRRKPVVLFAMMKDKAVGRAVRTLFPAAKAVVLASLPFERAAAPEEILSRAGPFREKIFLEPDLRKAIALAGRMAGSGGTVIAAGSLYLVGEIKKLRMSGRSG
ncbi:MAG: bifunctional folylpolyglutamate synthase/dihydrofolate synthase [Candidatus Aminicenantes bacterium]|nr:bifunctional folylpolyglutamate synthase/dihydrofolate synthase [Candidatus Aminicenantes bacterium]